MLSITIVQELTGLLTLLVEVHHLETVLVEEALTMEGHQALVEVVLMAVHLVQVEVLLLTEDHLLAQEAVVQLVDPLLQVAGLQEVAQEAVAVLQEAAHHVVVEVVDKT